MVKRNILVLILVCCIIKTDAGIRDIINTFFGKNKMAQVQQIPAEREEIPPRIRCKKDGSIMVLIPAGRFIFGMNKSKRDSILATLSYPLLDLFEMEYSEEKVTLPSFYIDICEITNRQYAVFTEETGHRAPRFAETRVLNRPKQPVVGVSFEDAQAYAEWTGKRLPSEQEWEKAARGPAGNIWPWGNVTDESRYNGKNQKIIAPVDVGSFENGASYYGVLDMAGNVYEMTTGIWQDSSRAMRGGCYLNAGALTRTTFRWASEDPNGTRWLGFRCVMSVEDSKRHATPLGE